MLKFVNAVALFVMFLFATGTGYGVEMMNEEPVDIRDGNLQLGSQQIPAGSSIRVTKAFWLQYLGTETPTPQQVQQFLDNPHRRLQTQSFVNRAGRRSSDYFLPVEVEDPGGNVTTGMMAVPYYHRNSKLITNGSVVSEDTRALRVEASANCATCAAVLPGNIANIAAVSARIQLQSNSLYEEYKKYAQNFSRQYRGVPNRTRKRIFVDGLIKKFGAEEASKIIAALTAFGEAPGRAQAAAQIADMAAVLKVIENRKENRYRTRSRLLRGLNVSVEESPRLAVTLADWQFSVWNDNDNNLNRILNMDYNTADAGTKRKLDLAFQTQSMITEGRVQFSRGMSNPRMHHYHANYVRPNWAQSNKRVPDTIVRVDGVDINISSQGGSRHLFYAGVP